jgi:hypothetical protein
VLLSEFPPIAVLLACCYQLFILPKNSLLYEGRQSSPSLFGVDSGKFVGEVIHNELSVGDIEFPGSSLGLFLQADVQVSFNLQVVL